MRELLAELSEECLVVPPDLDVQTLVNNAESSRKVCTNLCLIRKLQVTGDGVFILPRLCALLLIGTSSVLDSPQGAPPMLAGGNGSV